MLAMNNKKNTCFTILIISLFLFLITGCATVPKELVVESDYCETQYPILLVHGIAIRDDNVTITTWGDIPENLMKQGANVYKSRQEAFATHAANAKRIKEIVLRILKETNSSKINIIAHSKGGIEARYAISKYGLDKYVASLTTISTPHRGSIMVDQLLDESLPVVNFRMWLYSIYALILGDKNPDSSGALSQLTREYMEEFNKDVPDMDGVYYQSYASIISDHYSHPYFRKQMEKLFPFVGDNDGIISVESSKWGLFRGIVPGNVSHLDIVGLTDVTGNEDYEYCSFYIEAIHELKMMGF
jgi:triacylglycerol lipase